MLRSSSHRARLGILSEMRPHIINLRRKSPSTKRVSRHKCLQNTSGNETLLCGDHLLPDLPEACSPSSLGGDGKISVVFGGG
ncbi:hypothetical protein CCMA1212_006554 [Trichoderma ghanense]|uniref:Uncharacterized protein n=1 Tax=Trichoderma ghanense TaxID=65468 RepID=A0ABY2H2B1_9HYPO